MECVGPMSRDGVTGIMSLHLHYYVTYSADYRSQQEDTMLCRDS